MHGLATTVVQNEARAHSVSPAPTNRLDGGAPAPISAVKIIMLATCAASKSTSKTWFYRYSLDIFNFYASLKSFPFILRPLSTVFIPLSMLLRYGITTVQKLFHGESRYNTVFTVYQHIQMGQESSCMGQFHTSIRSMRACVWYLPATGHRRYGMIAIICKIFEYIPFLKCN